MPRILVCQHVPYEILGTLNPLLKDAGFRIRYVNFGRHPDARPSLEGIHGIVVLGGPMNVDDVDGHPHLAAEVELLAEAVERGLPMLGICLGAQLLAKALGACVRPNGEKEIGWYPVSVSAAGRDDPVLGGFRKEERIFQWHGDTFDIPDGAVRLAGSPKCRNQAFRHGANIYGFQFHLEVDEPLIERWLAVPGHKREIEALGGKIDPNRIRQDTRRYMAAAHVLSEGTFEALLAIFGGRKRKRALPSR